MKVFNDVSSGSHTRDSMCISRVVGSDKLASI